MLRQRLERRKLRLLIGRPTGNYFFNLEMTELEKVKAELVIVKSELVIAKSELEKVKAELVIAKYELGPVKEEYYLNSVYGNLKQIGEQLHDTQTAMNIWRNTPLEAINELKADPAGKVGEELLKTICLACESTGDKNSKDGTYDQKIGDALKKVEIKTARLGGGKYQHETLKKEGCDYWFFVDIKPDGGCLTILPLFDLTNKHPITGTTPTPRKGTTNVFKWDFSENHLNKFVSAGAAMKFDKNTMMSELGDFIKIKLTEYNRSPNVISRIS